MLGRGGDNLSHELASLPHFSVVIFLSLSQQIEVEKLEVFTRKIAMSLSITFLQRSGARKTNKSH